jgi:hypothetical protein
MRIEMPIPLFIHQLKLSDAFILHIIMLSSKENSYVYTSIKILTKEPIMSQWYNIHTLSSSKFQVIELVFKLPI